MKARNHPPSPLLPLAAFVVGLCTLFAAHQLSRPPLLDERVAALSLTIAGMARLNAQPGSAGALAIGAVCKDQPAVAAKTYHEAVSRLAATSGVPTAALSVTGGQSQGQLSPVMLHWKGRAPYDNLVAVLGALARQQPTLFVDALDMKARQGAVDFELKGTVWCWTPVNTRS